MNIDKLQRMVALYEERSFSKAALRLGLSQPALTWSIQQLEDELKVRLFNRGPRGIEPTPMCEKLIRRARLIMREQEGIRADAKEDGQGRLIVMGVHSGMVNGAFARCLEAFAEAAPDNTVRIEEGYSPALRQKLQQGEIDFAYCATAPTEDFEAIFHVEPVTTIRYSVVAAPHHPVFQDIENGETGRYPWAIFHATGATEDAPKSHANLMIEETGYARASQEVRTSSMNLMRVLAAEGGHLCLVADSLIAEDLARGQLKRLPQECRHEVEMGFVSLLGSYETPAVVTLKKILRRLAQEVAS